MKGARSPVDMWEKIRLGIIAGFVFVVAGTVMFVSGYHTFDLGHNLKYLDIVFETSLVDINNWGEVKTPSQLIQTGINKIYLGFMYALAGTFILGYCSRRGDFL